MGRTETNPSASVDGSACNDRAVTPRGTSHIATAAATSFGSVAVSVFSSVRLGSTPHTPASYPKRFCAQFALGTESTSVFSERRSRRNSEMAGKRSWSFTL